MIKRNDVITFSEDDKVVVLDVIQDEGKVYAFVNGVTPDEQDVTDKYMVMDYDTATDSMLEIKDKEILDKLLPIFSKRIENIINNIILQNAKKKEEQQ